MLNTDKNLVRKILWKTKGQLKRVAWNLFLSASRHLGSPYFFSRIFQGLLLSVPLIYWANPVRFASGLPPILPPPLPLPSSKAPSLLTWNTECGPSSLAWCSHSCLPPAHYTQTTQRNTFPVSKPSSLLVTHIVKSELLLWLKRMCEMRSLRLPMLRHHFLPLPILLPLDWPSCCSLNVPTFYLTSGLRTWFSSAWNNLLPDFCMASSLILFSSPLKCHPIQRELPDNVLPPALHAVCISDLLTWLFSSLHLSLLENIFNYFISE